MIYYFPEDIIFEGPSEFTDPFRYAPHPLVQYAASEAMKGLASWKEMAEGCPESDIEAEFAEGKMLGVLVCSKESRLCYIKAFSGNVGGNSMIDGFVPPIFDLTVPSGEFRLKESEITAINHKLQRLIRSDKLAALKNQLTEARKQGDEEIMQMRSEMAASKGRREKIRETVSDQSVLAELIKESQFEKAELKRLKDKWNLTIHDISSRLDSASAEINTLKKERAEMSDRLQNWIFNQYIVHNAAGEEASIRKIFADSDLVPPGGTGECAAPKLLEYAYRNGLRPLAMGEFWYGRSPETAVRTQGHFYPSCTSKCGPLLGFMTKGLRNADTNPDAYTSVSESNAKPIIIHEDETLIIVEKPSGMPSVPGLDGRLSLLEWLTARYYENHSAQQSVHAVHRLDMDTSGIMLFAKTEEAAICLRRQFEEHTIKKTYKARLSAAPQGSHNLTCGSKGQIELPLSADYDERPRQKVDFTQGKASLTEYEIVSIREDGTIDILFFPKTGRTHQLRVHSAHSLGLGHPIIGDLLYGAHRTGDCLHDTSLHLVQPEHRLCLHALSITFRHPATSEEFTFTSETLCYK